MRISCGTSYVLEDEPCLSLNELDLMAPDNSEPHRYRIINVVRNDKPTEFRQDLGKSSEFKGIDQIRIPGGWIKEQGKIKIEHSVGELLDIAHKIRGNSPFDKREVAQTNDIRLK